MAAITLDIGGNTRQLDRDIQKTVNKVYTINLKTKGDQPLGRITGQVNEFNKSLDASNARVIAFGASAGIIFGVERAFTALVSSTIEVQKSLQDINVILNVSAQNLQKFGGELFNIARNTGQSFQEVAKAATEFSRQGLGVEETLKRTNEALILSRLSGLDAAKSVESLTAAVNSFASQAVTATEVVNKFATVDAAFAVSSADLADAIARVGSSAAQSGVSLNELIAIVTSAQQTTARGGAVIGNSFKTIFTRLQREKVVDLLGSLGISGTNASGEVKSTIQLLQELGAVYDTLGSQQQAYVAEQVGGVFQINILKAALADLGKEYSIYSSALNVAAGATDQAIRRNEELNKTYSAQINALAENARQLAAAGGERLLGPSIDRLVGGTNTLLKGFSESDGQGVGAVLGKGILDGLGQFIAGPGLALIGGVLLKLFRDLAKFATGSVQQLLGLNTAATQQRDLQQSINSILAKNPQLLELALKGEQGLNQAANSLLASLQKQTVELQKQAQVAQQISKAFIAQAGVRVAGGVPVVPTPKPGRAGKAAGYIPNFASDKIIEKYTAISLGATSAVRPHMSQGTIGGKKFVMNNQEVEFPGVGKNGDSMVLPTYGDGPRIAAAGFIPNFAATGKKRISKETRQRSELFRKYGYLVPPGAGNGFLSGLGDEFPDKAIRVREPKLQNVDSNSNELKLEKNISNKITDDAVAFTNTLKPLGRTVNKTEIEKAFQTTAGAKGAISGAVGAAFEVAISKALDYKAAQREGGDFDVRGGKNLKLIQDLFGISVPLADFKVSTSGDAKSSFYDKVRKEEGLKRGNIEQQKNRDQNDARKEALTQLRSSNPEWFTKRGDKLLDPKNFPGGPEAYKQANDRLNIRTDRVLASYGGAGSGDAFRSLAARKRFAYGFIPNFAAPLVRAVDDKELKIMLSKFGKGWAFQGRSSEQSALEYFGGSGTYMWDALSRPGEQMSDRQAYKQNIGRAKNWASARKQSSWLVRYNRSKLKDSELLPDMETGGASVYGLPLSKDQIVWPIKQANGPGRIFEKDIPAFLSGQVNDAIKREREAGIPKNKIYLAQEKALTSANPMGLGVFNKLQEPTKRSRKDAMRRKGFARGYIPNFAIEDPDTQAADFGTAATAITAQLSTLAFAFAFNGGQYKESLKQLTAANLKRAKEELKQSRLEAKRLEQRGLGNFATTAREDASKRFRGAATPSIFTKGRAFGGANALGLSIAAPILGETIKNIAGQETATQRGIGAAGGALGQIGSFAATGALIAGPKGAAVGTAVGALLSVPDAINQFTSTLPDLTAAAKKASQDLTKFSDVSQRLLTTSDSLKNLITENAPPDKLKKVQDDFAKALSELTPAERARVDNAIKLNKLEEELAKITQEKIDKERSTVTAESLQEIEERKKFGIFAGGFDTSTKQGKEDAKVVGKAFSDLFTAGKTPEESLERFNKAASNGIPQLQNLIQSVGTFSKAQQLYSSGSVEQLRGILENIVPKIDDPNDQEAVAERAQRIQTLVDIADDDIPGFINLVKTLIGRLTDDPAAIKEAEDAIKNYQETVAKEEKNKKAAAAATEKIVESLERNIRVAQIAADKNRELAQSNTQFARNTLFADAFTRPTETVGAIVGQGAPLAESFALREEIARIGFDQIQGIENVKFNLVKNIENSISAAFSEALKETREKAPTEGTAKEIENTNKNILAPLAQQQEKAFNTVQNVLNKTLTAGTEINTEQLLKDINNELIKANIDAATREKIGTQIRESADAGNIAIEKLRNDAIQEFKTVAKEQSQKILIAKISQAQKFGGGIDQFLTEQAPGQSLFDQLIKATKGFDKFQGQQADFRFDYRRGTNDFKYQYGAAQRARQEMAPEYGRAALELIDQLQAFTGYTPNADGKAVQAGVAGLKEFYDRQIKELQRIAQDSGTPQIVKDEINSALKEVARLGGTENIAKLQVAQRTGALTETAFKEITGKFQSPILQALQEQAKSIKDPEERARFEEEIKTLSSDILVSSDPTVKAINVTNNILKQLLTALDIEYQPILSSSTSTPKTESKARGYIPAFNQESRAISRGVGGAKAGDRPKFIPNLNGIPAFVNTGEQLVDNFMGSGETAVLTRDMQNAMVAAKGFIPNFAKTIPPNVLKKVFETKLFENVEDAKSFINFFLDNQPSLSFNDIIESAKTEAAAGGGLDEFGRKAQLIDTSRLEKYEAVLKDSSKTPDEKAYARKLMEAEIKKQKAAAESARLRSIWGDMMDKVGPDIPQAASNKPIKPSELGGKGKNASKIVEETFRSGFKRVTDTSTYIDDITRASQEEVSNLAVKKAEEAAAKKAAEKATAKAAEKAGGNVAGKVAGKAVGKSVIKKIPLVGIAAGVGFGISRALEGDFTGAGLEVASGVTGTLPVAGTAASVGIDAALVARDIQTATAEAQTQAAIDAKARGSARGRKQTLEEKKLSEENKQQAIDKARYEFSTAFNKNWPLNSKDQQEFAKLWSGKPANETIPDFIKRIKESAPKQNYKTNITKATKDDLDRFYGRGKYAPLGSKERTDYENKSKISGLIADNQRAKFGVELNKETPLFKDPIQENIDKGAKASQALKPTIKSETVGLINGRPAIEWENDAKIDAMDDRVKRGEISQENANKYLEAELSKKTIENRRKERSKTSPKVIGGKDNKPAMQVGPTGSADYVPKAIRATPEEIEKERQQVAKPKSAYPGGMSPETARSIVQELDTNYNEAIKNQRNPQIAKAWAQTQQRYRLLYSQGKYEELDRFYKSLRKDYQRPIGQNPNKNQNQTNFAAGFIPNFAQDYISNLANLESGLSGKKARLTNIPGIGLAMINVDQTPGKFPSQDHPEGKMAAIRNSMKMQKSMGIMSKGYIPNFAATDQSFAQQEAAFNNNTSALTTLAGGIENLNSTLANFEANFANLNNIPSTQPAAGAGQASVQSNITVPVTISVGGANNNGDIAAEVAKEIQAKIPEIVEKVEIANGKKVPPTRR